MCFRTLVVLLAATVCAAQARAPQTTTNDSASNTPLTMEWSGIPTVNFNVVKGSVVVVNQADDDFDQTVIGQAVNEVGKAFALGYQHFPLQHRSHSVPISFEPKLAPGHYVVHADAVA